MFDQLSQSQERFIFLKRQWGCLWAEIWSGTEANCNAGQGQFVRKDVGVLLDFAFLRESFSAGRKCIFFKKNTF